MMLAGPPVNWWPLALFASLPLIWFLRRGTSRPGRDSLLLMAGVSPMWLLWEWWMADVTAVGFPFFILLQCSWTALFFVCARRLHQLAPRLPWFAIVPFVWVAVEFFRGEMFLSGYAAALAPYPLINWPVLAAPSMWLGVYFVSFMTILFACVLFEIAIGRGAARKTAVGILVLLAGLWSLAGYQLNQRPIGTDVVTPGIVQTNLPQSNKLSWGIQEEIRDFQRFSDLTEQLAQSSPPPDMILWPETMVPGETLQKESVDALLATGLGFKIPSSDRVLPPDAFYRALLDLQALVEIPMIVGEEARVNMKIDLSGERPKSSWDARYNSAYLIDSGQVQPERYDKVRLTPFGETMPFISRWPWLQNRLLAIGAQGMQFDLNAGTALTVLPVPVSDDKVVRVVNPICFEVTVSDHCRQMVFEKGQRRADLIANLTNDGWFGNSDIAREQHLEIAQWRCIELATPMARAANTGISALIDSKGRILARGVEGSRHATQVDGILKGSLTLGAGPTLYARVGEVFPWSVLGLILTALAASFVRKWLPGRSKGNLGTGIQRKSQ
jgi:apolipoprotein N-acyltransferase